LERELQRDHGVHEALLRAVVQIAHHPSAFLGGGGDDPSARCRELGAAVGVGDRGRDELGEVRDALLGVRRDSRPLTTIGLATADRMPRRWTVSVTLPVTFAVSSIRAARPVRKTIVGRLCPPAVCRVPTGIVSPTRLHVATATAESSAS
jgi:hypothetical protein